MSHISNYSTQPASESPQAQSFAWTRAAKAPLILVLIALTMFLPEETSFAVGQLRLTVTRLLLLIVTPAVCFRFVRMLLAGEYRFVWADVLVPIAGIWMFVGPAINDGLERAIVNSGSSAMEFCIPYMVARTYLAKRGQALALVRIICIAIAVVGILGLFDEAVRRFALREAVGAITGYNKTADFNYPDLMRMFLFRAASTLEHPILLGTACAIGLFLTTSMRGTSRAFAFFGCSLGLVLSLSSAPVSGAIIGFSFIAYEKISRGIPYRWLPVIFVPVFFLALVFSLHPNPIGFLFNHIVFQPDTAYYRLLQWQCVGGDLVMSSPIIGVGLSDEWVEYCELAKTIDSIWLGFAKLYGIPGSLLVLFSWIGAASIPIGIGDDQLNLNRRERQLGFALNVVLIVMIYIGLTVFYWGTVYILTGFLMGIRAHLGAFGSLEREANLDDDG